MSDRKLITWAAVAGAVLLALLGVTIYATTAPTVVPQRGGNALHGRPMMLDRLVMFDTDHAFVQGALNNVAVHHDLPARVVLDDRQPKDFPRRGLWTSAEIRTNFNFTELLPSWNASTPPDTGLRITVRTRNAESGTWSPWLSIGRWGRTGDTKKEPPVSEFDGGKVSVDTLVLYQPADAFAVRAELQSFDLDRSINPMVRRIAVSYSGQAADQDEFDRLHEPAKPGSDWARDLPVPYRAQGDSPDALASQICSPTSTTMLMAYCGVTRPIIENASAIYDDQANMFGNWGRAVARAGELGLDAWLVRVRDWDTAKSYISAGQPLVVAIRFKPEEFPSSVLKKGSNGHLIVIRGFTAGGDVICNDPGNRAHGNDVVYKADELATAWFKNSGGVAYIIRKPGGAGESVTMK